MLGRALSILLVLAATGCADDGREAEIASVLARANDAVSRARPALVAGMYTTMAGDAFSFYRGELPLFASDWTRGALDLASSDFDATVTPLAIGDPHPENFGCLLARDGSIGFEPNDFDHAGRAPFTWDLRRLAIGLDLAARLANEGDATAQAASVSAARSVARAAASSYASAIADYANGAPRARVIDATGQAILGDVLDRCHKHDDDGSTFDDLTVLVNGVRTMKRGVIDPTQPWQVLEDLPREALDALPATLEAWRSTLLDPPPSDDLVILDAARELGSGVASWPLVRVLILLRGPTDDPSDDLVIELKEIGDATLPNAAPLAFLFDSPQARVLTTTRAAWATPDADPLWGTATWLGLPVQARTESSAEKKISVDRLTSDRGAPDALVALGATLGGLLARVHASPIGEETEPQPAKAIARAIGTRTDDFADEQANVADAYAQQVIRDRAIFVQALADYGPTLGVPADPFDAPSADLTALFGAPP